MRSSQNLSKSNCHPTSQVVFVIGKAWKALNSTGTGERCQIVDLACLLAWLREDINVNKVSLASWTQMTSAMVDHDVVRRNGRQVREETCRDVRGVFFVHKLSPKGWRNLHYRQRTHTKYSTGDGLTQYLRNRRGDISFATKEVLRQTAKPTNEQDVRHTRTRKYLLRAPSCIQESNWRTKGDMSR